MPKFKVNFTTNRGERFEEVVDAANATDAVAGHSKIGSSFFPILMNNANAFRKYADDQGCKLEVSEVKPEPVAEVKPEVKSVQKAEVKPEVKTK